MKKQIFIVFCTIHATCKVQNKTNMCFLMFHRFVMSFGSYYKSMKHEETIIYCVYSMYITLNFLCTASLGHSMLAWKQGYGQIFQIPKIVRKSKNFTHGDILGVFLEDVQSQIIIFSPLEVRILLRDIGISSLITL